MQEKTNRSKLLTRNLLTTLLAAVVGAGLLLYFFGSKRTEPLRGVPRDVYKLSVSEYRDKVAAAERGDATAARSIAHYFLFATNNLGCTYEWMHIAAKNGDSDAGDVVQRHHDWKKKEKISCEWSGSE
jgi:hypothetical protein